MAAGELPDRQGGGRARNRRDHSAKPAPVWELGVQERVIFVKFLTELIGNHFEASPKPAGFEGNGLFLADDSVAFVPPGGIRIAHDFADASVQQQRLNRSKEGQDQFEAHSGYLTSIEAQRFARLPRMKNNGLGGGLLLGRFIVFPIFRGSLFSTVQL